MDTFSHVAGVAQVIQLAVAPVFLLAGVGATLNVLASRIGRIIDRARIMEDRLSTATPELSRDLHARLRVLADCGWQFLIWGRRMTRVHAPLYSAYS